MKRFVLYIFCSIVIAAAIWATWQRLNHTIPGAKTGFDTSQYSLSDPTSPWVVVNKQRQLQPADYAPSDLVTPDIPLRPNITDNEKYVRSALAPSLKSLVSDAAKQGIQLNLQSGYRSYAQQVKLYNTYVRQQGKSVADKQSARPGYSEHQTGWAVDLGSVVNPGCDIHACFANSTEGKWLATNAYLYGFMVRYTADKTTVTGYEYEPWHLRYVGAALSQEMHKQHIETLEEFFGLPSAAAYR